MEVNILKCHDFSQPLQKLKTLCHHLRHNADRILDGTMGLSLSDVGLYELNTAVRNLKDGRYSPCIFHLAMLGDENLSETHVDQFEDWKFYLQLVMDIMSRNRVLEVHRVVGGGEECVGFCCNQLDGAHSLDYPIHFHYFGSLRHLKISHIGVQLLQDMFILRDQLESLTIHSCHSDEFHMQDVLEGDCQDDSASVLWAALTAIRFFSVKLSRLDGSLRLCPRLEYLDLSNNRITATESYLGYLVELCHMDLSHNKLTHIPALSASAKNRMKSLVLCDNRISSLDGLDDMTGLELLDISDNLITNHELLLPLRGLHRLNNFSMSGCPASLRRDHRHLALHFVSTVSLSRKFSLDCRHVSRREIKRLFRSPSFQDSRSAVVYHEFLQQQNAFRASGGNPQPGPNSGGRCARHGDRGLASVAKTLQQRARRKAKTRTMDISDMETSASIEISSGDVTPAITPEVRSQLEEIMQMRKQQLLEKKVEVELLREYYGESWLQAAKNQSVLPRPDLSPGTLSVAVTASAPIASDESITTTAASAGVGLHDTATDNVDANISTTHGRHSEYGGASERDVTCRVFDRETMFSSGSDGFEGFRRGPTLTAIPNAASEPTIASMGAGVVVSEGSDGWPSDVVRSGYAARSSWCRVKEQEFCLEPEDESEPFIVTMKNTGEIILVSLSSCYVIEKDINLCMIDYLDLQCLASVRVNVLSHPESRGDAALPADSQVEIDVAGKDDCRGNSSGTDVLVLLSFDHIRKDRQLRAYIMEDFDAAETLQRFVQPFVDARNEAARKEGDRQFQCLKCCAQFPCRQAMNDEDVVPRSGSSKDFALHPGCRKEVDVILHCPKCGSDVLIQLDESIDVVGNHSLTRAPVRGSETVLSTRHLRRVLSQLFHSRVSHSVELKHSSSDLQLCHKEQLVPSSRKASMPSANRLPSTLSLSRDTSVPKECCSQAPMMRVADRSGKDNFCRKVPSEESSGRRSHTVESVSEIFRHGSDSGGSVGGDSCNTGSRVSEELSGDGCFLADGMNGRLADESLQAAADLPPPVGDIRRGASDLSLEISGYRAAGIHKTVSGVDLVTSDGSPVFDCRVGEADCGRNFGHQGLHRICNYVSPVGLSGAEDAVKVPVSLGLDSDRSAVTGVCGCARSTVTVASDVYDDRPPVTVPEVGVATSVNGPHFSWTSGHQENFHWCDPVVCVSGNRLSAVTPSSSANFDCPHESGVSCSVDINRNDVLEREVDLVDYDDDDSVTGIPTVRVPGVGDPSRLDYRFKELDHRLALYLMMNVFHSAEEFIFNVETTISQYMVRAEYEGLVVVTNFKLYILRSSTNTRSIADHTNFSESLVVTDALNLGSLRSVHIGLGRQTVRMEFGSDSSSYTLIIRDSGMLGAIKALLSEALQAYATEAGLPTSVTFFEHVDQMTLDTLASDVLKDDGDLQLYSLGFIARVAFVVTTSKICLVKPSHRWPPPTWNAPPAACDNGRQFTVLERQPIDNMATVSVHPDNPNKLRLAFFNEESGDETCWLITMETLSGVTALVESLRKPWEEAFGVRLDVDACHFVLPA